MATKYWMISNRSVDGNRLSGAGAGYRDEG